MDWISTTAVLEFFTHLELGRPWALALLVLLPVLLTYLARSHAALGRARRRLAMGCCLIMVAGFTVMLADVRLKPRTTVIFVIDRSLSIPDDADARRGERWQRLRDFIERSCARSGVRDWAGIIVFGRQA